MNTEKRKLLIIEDDPGLQSQLKWCFEDFDVTIAGDRTTAMQYVRLEKPAVVITDLGLPPDPGGSSEGFAILDEVISLDTNIKVIVVTGREEKANAVKAIGMGAYDYYQKPIDVDTLKFVVERAYRLTELEHENIKLIKSQAQSASQGMIGSCPQMLDILKTIDKIATTSVTVLILGETGTGKGELAKALHQQSDRSDKKFVTINCTSIPEALLESELFGHEKGAFTGAVARKIGKIEYANGGTLFLDEIGDMPLSLQAKILHVLQERTISRVGGNEEIPLDLRIVCATHQKLSKRIEEGLFREDLYYRISEICVETPPLRDRGEDIMLLAHFFLRKFASQQNRPINSFSKTAITALHNSSWPGNIRELENKIKRAVVMADRPILTVEDLELRAAAEEFSPKLLKDVKAEAESEAIITALVNYNSISDAAKSLGITRPTLYNLINKYELGAYISSNQKKSSEAED
ncbi:MAG: PEP-CTERM-box response regulator transcription factor [SAR86 cluster bacterium]|uniref:PEP-CTERM-box response regulator transcription factor n=1 Tax=SAR86 cluster bacterium TaxID=2030880 RepID=A0A2A5B704_9GAMM|nr:MAG: PEP-CTERM-box response regulator transcription factor [SAR86 cluster bacterium]